MATQNGENRTAGVPSESDSTIPPRTQVGTPPRGRATRPATKTATRPASPTTVAHVQPRRAERRPEMIRQQREDRRKAFEKQQRQWLLTKIGLIAFGVVVAVGLGVWIFSYVRDQQLNQRPEGTRDFAYVGSEHTASLEETVAYAETPPVGGTHAPAPYWQNCGFYDTPVRNETAVHSLEHGAVWITYEPSLPQEQIAILREKAEQSYVLVSPYEGLPSPVVASSWGHQLQLESVDDERLDQFIRYFRQGPDTPEPGAACSGGWGRPSK